MAYQKRYEDSYLDDEDEDLNDARTDKEKLTALLQKDSLSPKEIERAKKIAGKILDQATISGDKEMYYWIMDIITELA